MQTGSLINHIYSGVAQIKPEVGMGATVLGWTDRHAGTITEVDSKGGFTVQLDRAKRADSNGMSDCQEYTFTADPAGLTYRFAPVTRGKAKGQIRENGRKDGRSVLIGKRDHYYDFSF